MEEITYSVKNYTRIPKKKYGNKIENIPAPPPSPLESDYQNPPEIYQQNPPEIYQQNPPDIYQQNPPDIYQQNPPEIPQSLRNHALPSSFGGNQDEILNKLRSQPISGYTAPKKIKPSNNRGGTYSRYIDQPGETQTSPYASTGYQHYHKTGFNKAYAIKPCIQCNYPLDQCQCSMAQNSRK
jgi:hypothetical protein